MSYNFQKYVKTYTNKVTLPGSKKEIELRPLTTNDMKKLLVYENENDPLVAEEALDKIFKDAVLTEDFDVNDLYIQDRYFLFIELRKITKGTVYTFTFNCKECKSQSPCKLDFNDLEVKNMDKKESVIEILDGNIKLKMGHIKRGEQKQAYSIIDKHLTPTQKQIEMMLCDLACSIKEIITEEGTEDVPIKEKVSFIGDLPSKEYDIIKKWQEDNNFGIELKTKGVCLSCSAKEEINIPLDNFFA